MFDMYAEGVRKPFATNTTKMFLKNKPVIFFSSMKGKKKEHL
jgi:hypothetical protein